MRGGKWLMDLSRTLVVLSLSLSQLLLFFCSVRSCFVHTTFSIIIFSPMPRLLLLLLPKKKRREELCVWVFFLLFCSVFPFSTVRASEFFFECVDDGKREIPHIWKSHSTSFFPSSSCCCYFFPSVCSHSLSLALSRSGRYVMRAGEWKRAARFNVGMYTYMYVSEWGGRTRTRESDEYM